MSARSRLFSATFALAMVSPLATLPLFAVETDQTPPEVANTKYTAPGTINANAVYIRSGAGEGFYPTIKLDKGALVTVVGMKFEWLKIEPPDGSFCYVAQAYVQRFGDGKRGRVTKPDLNVRVGSSLNAMKTTIQTKLNEGDEVQILGEQDEYFKIKPPEGTYLFVNKQFVDPPKEKIAAGTGAVAPDTGSGTAAASNGGGTAGAAGHDTGVSTTQPTEVVADNTGPTTHPSDQASATTQPSAEQEFDNLESQFMASAKKPLAEQPVNELLPRYEALVKSADLPDSMRRIAESRAAVLRVHADDLKQLAAVQKAQEEMKARQVSLKAEQQEISDRLKKNDVQMFTAVGTLRTSSLQQGRETLYRLTDPNTGRTVVYIRSNDPKYVELIGQFIGVRGAVNADDNANMKFIAPKEAVVVDPAKVNQSVAAEMIPPSLLPKSETASTGD